MINLIYHFVRSGKILLISSQGRTYGSVNGNLYEDEFVLIKVKLVRMFEDDYDDGDGDTGDRRGR